MAREYLGPAHLNNKKGMARMSYSKFHLLTLTAIALVARPITVQAAVDDSVSPNWPETFAKESLDTIQQPGSILSGRAMTSDAVVVASCFRNDTGCGDGCDDVGCGSGCCCDKRLLGLFAKSDHCFDSFISPMTNPVFFEDPRTLTEVRTFFIYQNVPGAVGGGSVRLIAAQMRAALTDRLSIVAAKDGFIMSSNPLVDDGWADVSVGLKYNLLKNYQDQRIVSAGLSYEAPWGTPRALQGNGDGEFHIYLTGGTQLGDNWHWISASGFRIPADHNVESQMWYWSNHLDYRLTDMLYLVSELNLYHWNRSGGIPALAGVEGGDLINLGSTAVGGNDIVTQAIGAKLKPSGNTEIGFAWEFPLTDRRDLLENRLMVDFILRY